MASVPLPGTNARWCDPNDVAGNPSRPNKLSTAYFARARAQGGLPVAARCQRPVLRASVALCHLITAL
jgi:hypothetical protein